MKKKLKFLSILTAVLGIPMLINYIVFKIANKKSGLKLKQWWYKWEYGKISYVTAGKGKPLLLIHGIEPGAGLHEWEKNIEILSKHYKVYALDLLGFGRSDKPKLSYSSSALFHI